MCGLGSGLEETMVAGCVSTPTWFSQTRLCTSFGHRFLFLVCTCRPARSRCSSRGHRTLCAMKRGRLRSAVPRAPRLPAEHITYRTQKDRGGGGLETCMLTIEPDGKPPGAFRDIRVTQHLARCHRGLRFHNSVSGTKYRATPTRCVVKGLDICEGKALHKRRTKIGGMFQKYCFGASSNFFVAKGGHWLVQIKTCAK